MSYSCAVTNEYGHLDEVTTFDTLEEARRALEFALEDAWRDNEIYALREALAEVEELMGQGG